MKGLHVTAAGIVHEKPEENMYYVLTRRQEKCKQKRAREDNLNQKGITLFEKGPEGDFPSTLILELAEDMF